MSPSSIALGTPCYHVIIKCHIVLARRAALFFFVVPFIRRQNYNSELDCSALSLAFAIASHILEHRVAHKHFVFVTSRERMLFGMITHRSNFVTEEAIHVHGRI